MLPPKDALIRINGDLYIQSTEPAQDGDKVIDSKDGLYGVVELVRGDRCCVSDGFCAEGNVPLSRLIKLVPVNAELSNVN